MPETQGTAITDLLRGARLRPFLWFILAVALLYAAALNDCWRFQRDSVLYMGLARSLAETGKYHFDYLPHTFVLPGFPAMLSLIYMTVGESFLSMNVLVSAFGVGCVAVGYLVFRQLPLSDRQVTACVLLFGLSRTLYYYSTHVMTDVPFTFFALLGLFCGVKMVRTKGRASWLWSVGGSLAVCAASSIRPFGPAVAAGLIGALWLRPGGLKRWRVHMGKTAVVLAPLGVALVVWLYCRMQVSAPLRLDYFTQFVGRRGLAATPIHALGSIPLLIKAVPDALLGVRLPVAVGGLLSLVLGVGLVASLRRGERVLFTYGLVYLAGVSLGGPGRRYLLPVLPVLVFWLVVGVDRIGFWLTERWKLLSCRRALTIGYVLLGLALATNLGRIGKVVYESRSPNFYEVAEGPWLVHYFEMARWLRDNASPQALVFAREDRLLHYFSRVTTAPPGYLLRRGARARLPAVLGQLRACYVVRDLREGAPEAAALDELTRSHPHAFGGSRVFGAFELRQVYPDRLAEADQ